MACDDAGELMQWRREVIEHVFGPRGEEMRALTEAGARYYAEALADGSHEGCVAYLDGAPAGCGALCRQREMPSPDNPGGLCGYLMNVYVREPYRGNGVGRGIVEWLVERARAYGAGKVYLESADGAEAFYGSVGFRPMAGMMKLP